ncbi:MAG: ABC transporter permease [Planctomycetota bacterium]|jgi:ABC-type lipoprotein release transport system permease subunit
MLKLFLWLRYLRRKKIVLLSIAAVALSVALLIVVDSLFTGFIEAMQSNYVTDAGDVLITSGETSISKYDVLINRLEQLDEIEAASTGLFGWALLHLETGDVREVMVQGIKPAHDDMFTNWRESLLRQHETAEELNFEVPGYPDDIGGWVGINIVAEPDETTDEYDSKEVRKLIGKQVVLTTYGRIKVRSEATGSSEEQKTLWKRKPRYLKLRISDIAFTQTFHGDRTLYLDFEKFSRLQFGDEETVAARFIKIKLADGIDAESMRGKIFDIFEKFAAQQLGWSDEVIARTQVMVVEQEIDTEYFTELHKQKGVLLLIFGVICSVAILLIFCIFYMIVMTKQKDIAIIKSCGATSGAAALIFTAFGAYVGIVGSAFGILIGYIVTTNINTLEDWVSIVFGLKLWRSSSYILNMIPNQVDWPAVWPIVLAAVGGCVVGALIPAVVAARTKPVKILRYE